MESLSYSLEMEHKLSEQYKFSCEVCGTYPELKYLNQFSKGELLIDLSSINTPAIEVVCHAIAQCFTPFVIEITRTGIRSKSGTVAGEKKNLFKILKAIGVALKMSRSLTILKFENLLLSSSMLSALCHGLAKTTYLRVLHFKNCPMKSDSLVEICCAIKNVSCISTLAFNNCRLDAGDVKIIKSLITHQGLNRAGMLWKDTLRAQLPNLDEMKGLRYLLLNNNPHIGDEGARDLLLALFDDIWITGLELQNCGITSKSIEDIYDMLKVNQVIKHLSLENNTFLDSEFVLDVSNHLRKRNPDYVPLQEERRVKKNASKKIQKARVKLASKIKRAKRGIPWRIEGRLIERKEGLPIGTLSVIFKEIRKTSAENSHKSSKDNPDVEISLHHIRRIICYYKTKVKAEAKRRLEAEERIQRLERRLKRYEETIEGNYILDESTFFHVERCFSKFQSLLVKFRQAGYQWQNTVAADQTESFHTMKAAPIGSLQSESKSKSSSHSSQGVEESCSGQSAPLYNVVSSKQTSSQSTKDAFEECALNANADISLLKNQLEAVKDRLIQISEKSLIKCRNKARESFMLKGESSSHGRHDGGSSSGKVIVNDPTARAQRDKAISKASGKEAEAEYFDQETEVDRRMVNGILMKALHGEVQSAASSRKKVDRLSSKSTNFERERLSKRSESNRSNSRILPEDAKIGKESDSSSDATVSKSKSYSDAKNGTDNDSAIRKSPNESYCEVKSSASHSCLEVAEDKTESYSQVKKSDESYSQVKNSTDKNYSDFQNGERESSSKKIIQTVSQSTANKKSGVSARKSNVEISSDERSSEVKGKRRKHVDEKFVKGSDGSVVSEEIVESKVVEESDDADGDAPMVQEASLTVGKSSYASDVSNDSHSSDVRKGSAAKPDTYSKMSPNDEIRLLSSNSTNVTNSSNSASSFNMKNVHFYAIQSDAEPSSPATDDEKLSKRMTKNLTDRKPSTILYRDKKRQSVLPAQNDTKNVIDLLQERNEANVSFLGDKTLSEKGDRCSPRTSFRSSGQPSVTSISQQLSLGYENWTKEGRGSQREELSQMQDSRTEDFESDFEVSDLEGITISTSSLTASESNKSNAKDF